MWGRRGRRSGGGGEGGVRESTSHGVEIRWPSQFIPPPPPPSTSTTTTTIITIREYIPVRWPK